MKNSSKLAGVAGAALLASLSVPASAATTISGIISNVTANTGDGLLIDYTPIGFSLDFNSLNTPQTAAVLQIGTPESDVADFWPGQQEDEFEKLITVTFQFFSPSGVTGDPITGTTRGFYEFFTECGALAGGCGKVTWDGPVEFSFPNQGKFSLELSDAVFATDGDKHWGDAIVDGKFTLLSAGVPEPSTWAMMILGFGLIGGVMRRRQRQTVRYNFA